MPLPWPLTPRRWRRLRELQSRGEIHLNSYLETDSAERSLERALEAWDGYHTRTMARINDGQIVIEDPALLLYYQNRLVPFAEQIAGEGDQQAALEIAALAGVM